MVARLIAVTAALMMSGAPIAMLACQGVCAARATEAGGIDTHHSCHHEATTSSDLALTSSPHVCGHTDEGPTAVATSLWSFAAPALAPAVFTLVAPPPQVIQRYATTADSGPPLITSSPTQLRI